MQRRDFFKQTAVVAGAVAVGTNSIEAGQTVQPIDNRKVSPVAFPEKRIMRQSYPILDKMALLLPFLWVHRLLGKLRENPKRIFGYLKNASDQEIQKEIDLMQYLGLCDNNEDL